LDDFIEILDEWLIVWQMDLRQGECLFVDFDCLLEPFKMLKLYTHIMISNGQYSKPLIINGSCLFIFLSRLFKSGRLITQSFILIKQFSKELILKQNDTEH